MHTRTTPNPIHITLSTLYLGIQAAILAYAPDEIIRAVAVISIGMSGIGLLIVLCGYTALTRMPDLMRDLSDGALTRDVQQIMIPVASGLTLGPPLLGALATVMWNLLVPGASAVGLLKAFITGYSLGFFGCFLFASRRLTKALGQGQDQGMNKTEPNRKTAE